VKSLQIYTEQLIAKALHFSIEGDLGRNINKNA
jgi:hypothetical protein